MSYIEQLQAIGPVVEAIRAGYPTEYGPIEIQANCVASLNQVIVTFTDEDLKVHRVDATTELAYAIHQYRDAFYIPGKGSWYSAHFTYLPAGGLDVSHNYDDEPEWGQQVPSQYYSMDNIKYPRDVESQPDWLKAKIAEVSASSSNNNYVESSSVPENEQETNPVKKSWESFFSNSK